MFTRIRAIAFGAFVLAPAFAAGPLPSAAAPPAGYVRLSIYQPSFGGQLVFAGFKIGKVLHTADGGQVFGFDVNHAGDDGLLASAQTVSASGQVLSSVETFSQSSATITKVLVTKLSMDDYVAEGIFAGDTGLVLHEHVISLFHIKRTFHILNPVSGQSFTTFWTPPVASLLVNQIAEDQSTGSVAVFGTQNDNPIVFSSNVGANKFGPILSLDPNLYGGGNGPQLGEDEAHHLAVIALSPDGGAVGGSVPLMTTINLNSGKMTQFNGFRVPPFNSGFVNGLAVDGATDIACTTTELDADVEFYSVIKGSFVNIAELPGSNNQQFFSGEAVVNDPIHKLFLVAQPNGSVGPAGDSVIDVFDETGKLVKSIKGFKAFGVTPGLTVNPATRMGFISGPTPDALTQFTY